MSKEARLVKNFTFHVSKLGEKNWHGKLLVIPVAGRKDSMDYISLQPDMFGVERLAKMLMKIGFKQVQVYIPTASGIEGVKAGICAVTFYEDHVEWERWLIEKLFGKFGVKPEDC